MSTRRTPVPDHSDRSAPTLLIVSLVTVLAGVIGVIAVAATSADWAVLAALAVVLAGLVMVARTMQRQLGEDGDDD